MNRQEEQKAVYEKKWAQAFIDWINNDHGNDYEIIEDEHPIEGMADVDITAKSKSGTLPILYLQLTTDDRHIETFRHDGKASPVFSCNNIEQAVKEKAEKYAKQKKDFSKITLIIQGGLSTRMRKAILTPELSTDCSKYQFKNIYYISAPMISGQPTNSGTRQDWFIKKLS